MTKVSSRFQGAFMQMQETMMFMGFWCGTKTSTEASAWTHEHGMWDRWVSPTTTDPCTETQARNTDSITPTAFITHRHWKQEGIGNKYYYRVILPTLHQSVLTTICMGFNDKLFIMSPRSSYFFLLWKFYHGLISTMSPQGVLALGRVQLLFHRDFSICWPPPLVREPSCPENCCFAAAAGPRAL